MIIDVGFREFAQMLLIDLLIFTMIAYFSTSAIHKAMEIGKWIKELKKGEIRK